MSNFTYRCLVPESVTADAALGAYAKLFSTVERKLFAATAAGGDPDDLKADFCQRYGLTARQFNAVSAQLRGRIHGVKERIGGLIKELTGRIAKAKQVAKKLLKPPKTRRGTPPETLDAKAARKQKLHHKRRRLASLQQKLQSLEADHEKGVVRITFGSRDLFRAQYNLEAAGYHDHAEWLHQWRAARNCQFFCLGSKDETSGCQSCVATINEDESLNLRVRLPDALIEDATIEKEGGKYLILRGLKFAYGHENVLKAIRSSQLVPEGDRTRRDGVALSWRFIRDEKQGKPRWYAHVTVDVTAPPIVTRREAGALGVDFNADHVALADVDRSGNLIDHERIDTHLRYKTSDQRDAIIGDAVKQVAARALAAGRPVVIEKLDFSAKKSRLEDVDVERSRMLSGLAYRQFDRFLKAACFRAGVELVEVNAAYTSVIGAVNHARTRGVSIHVGAAAAIARRALRFKHADAPYASVMRDGAVVPTRNGAHVTFPLPVRTEGKHVWGWWARVKRSLSTAIESHYRCGSSNHDPPPLSELRASGAVQAPCATGSSGPKSRR